MFTNRPALGNEENTQDENIPSIDIASMKEHLFRIRDTIQKRILTEFDGEVTIDNIPRLRNMVEEFFDQV